MQDIKNFPLTTSGCDYLIEPKKLERSSPELYGQSKMLSNLGRIGPNRADYIWRPQFSVWLISPQLLRSFPQHLKLMYEKHLENFSMLCYKQLKISIFLHQIDEAKAKKGFMKRYFITYRLQKLFYLQNCFGELSVSTEESITLALTLVLT